MEEFKNELLELLKKHDATITVEADENDSFSTIQLRTKGKKLDIDSGYLDMEVSPFYLERANINSQQDI